MSSTRSGSSTSPSNPYLVKRSYSTPGDESSSNRPTFKTPPVTPSRSTGGGGGSGGKMIAFKILLLDDSVTIIQAQTKALGRLVFDQICKQLNVLEADYFGLEYDDGVRSYWLDLEKRLTRQVGLTLCDPLLRFSVKFYTPDPSQLEEEFTRYLFSLQIKRDLASGVLHCNDNTAALMASFIVQAECGDFSEEDYPDASYLSVYKFVPHQNYEMERRIRDNHRKHIGQSPAEADLHLLETARRTELYGIRMHPAKDEDGVSLNLSVCHMGVLVFQNTLKINTFSWAKIRKISFKRKRFILKLHPETYGYYKELVEFVFDSRNECKSYWKRCVEHHAFFRCEKAPNPIQRSKGILSSRGSSFRYSGRTQKQMVAFVRENFVKRPPGGGGGLISLSQQNLSSGPITSRSMHDNNEFQRSSSFKSQQHSHHHHHRYGLDSAMVVSNSRSSPAMIGSEKVSDIRYNDNNTHQEDDDLNADDEEFEDYDVEKKRVQHGGGRRGDNKESEDEDEDDDSVESEQQQQQQQPQHLQGGHQQQQQQQQGSGDLSELERDLLSQLMREGSTEEDEDESLLESSSVVKRPKLFSVDAEFPVTTYKTPQKVSRSATQQVISSSQVNNVPQGIVSSRSLEGSSSSRKRPPTNKSLVRSVEFEEDDQESFDNFKGSSGVIAPGQQSSQGSYDLLETLLTFDEVEVPYLLRRRIDIDSNSTNGDKKVVDSNKVKGHHETLSKSRSYGGGSGRKLLMVDSSSSSSSKNQQQRIPQGAATASGRLVSFCSMVDLPPANNFSWRDDSIDSNVGGISSAAATFVGSLGEVRSSSAHKRWSSGGEDEDNKRMMLSDGNLDNKIFFGSAAAAGGGSLKDIVIVEEKMNVQQQRIDSVSSAEEEEEEEEEGETTGGEQGDDEEDNIDFDAAAEAAAAAAAEELVCGVEEDYASFLRTSAQEVNKKVDESPPPEVPEEEEELVAAEEVEEVVAVVGMSPLRRSAELVEIAEEDEENSSSSYARVVAAAGVDNSRSSAGGYVEVARDDGEAVGAYESSEDDKTFGSDHMGSPEKEDDDLNSSPPPPPPPPRDNDQQQQQQIQKMQSLDGIEDLPLDNSSTSGRSSIAAAVVAAVNNVSPPPPPPPHNSNNGPGQHQQQQQLEEDFEWIDKSEATNTLSEVVMFKTRFLSRISERTHDSSSEFMSAPLVTSELGDSSATLNDLEEIVDYQSVQHVVELEEEEAEEEEAAGEGEEETGDEVLSVDEETVVRRRVSLQLRVVRGEIVFE